MKMWHLGLCFVLAVSVFGQNRDDRPLSCDDQARNGDRRGYCEIKEQNLGAARGPIRIDGNKNGGVRVTGWDRADVQIRARIQTWADTDAEAKTMAGQIRLASGPTDIVADGPTPERWSVTYEVSVPRRSDLTVKTHNGGVSIRDVQGQMSFNVHNGGVRLHNVGGDVQGQTTNGGVHIELAGSRWDGRGLDVKTTNGGVHLQMPENYSAHLETSTTNGGMHVDFPLTVHGKIGKELSTDLGGGGPTIRVVTTNGGVHVSRTGAA